MTAGFAPASVGAGNPTTLSVSADMTVAQSTYSLTVSGVANGVTHSLTITVKVTTPQVTATIGKITSPGLSQPNNVYASVPCTATASASADPLPGGYSASQLVANWSYSTIYLAYSKTGNDETWVTPSDNSTASVTLNGAATSSAGTFNAVFNTPGFYEACIAATVSYQNPTTNESFGPYTGYVFASSSNNTGASSVNLKETKARLSPAGVPSTSSEPTVQVSGVVLILSFDNGSYVRSKSSHPAGYLFTTAVTVENLTSTTVNATISSQDGHLGFSATPNPTSDLSSLSIAVPGIAADGTLTPLTVYVTGEAVSSKVGDAEIDLKDAKSGTLYTKGNMTVFGFTNPKMNVTVGGSYSIVSQGVQQVLEANPNAVTLSASADLVPSGADVTVAAIKNLKLGIIQNGYSRTDTVLYGNPRVTWQSGKLPGTPTFGRTSISVPNSFGGARTPVQSATVDSFSASDVPFYNRSDMASIASPTTTCGDSDNPLSSLIGVFSVTWPDSDQDQQNVNYYLNTVTIATSFEDWCTIYDSSLPAKHQDEWLCESSWSLSIGSNSGSNSTATIGSQNSTTFQDAPVESGSTYNQLLAKSAGITTTASSQQSTIIYPSSQ